MIPAKDRKIINALLPHAERGDVGAMYELARCYDNVIYNKGVYRWHYQVDSTKWLKKAAEHGHREAQCSLAYSYLNGTGGLDTDHGMAIEWYTKAAEGGYLEAMYRLGETYKSSYFADQDLQKSTEWYKKAAEKGHALAQYELGKAFAEGRGVDQDNNEALRWIKKSAEQGELMAKFALAYPEGRIYKANPKEATPTKQPKTKYSFER